MPLTDRFNNLIMDGKQGRLSGVKFSVGLFGYIVSLGNCNKKLSTRSVVLLISK